MEWMTALLPKPGRHCSLWIRRYACDMNSRPNHALQQTRRERRGCNPYVPCAGPPGSLGVSRAFSNPSMGNSLSWLAVKGRSPEAVLGELELRPTGKPGEAGRSPCAAAASDTGWYLIVASCCEHPIISAPVVGRV